jgi:hypothetical protein
MPKAKKKATIQIMIAAFGILNLLFDWVEKDIFLSVMTLGLPSFILSAKLLVHFQRRQPIKPTRKMKELA